MWISVDDRLPPSGQYVLVSTYYMGEFGPTYPWYQIDMGFMKLDGHFEWGKGGIKTHWMPLPELPAHKEENKNERKRKNQKRNGQAKR